LTQLAGAVGIYTETKIAGGLLSLGKAIIVLFTAT